MNFTYTVPGPNGPLVITLYYDDAGFLVRADSQSLVIGATPASVTFNPPLGPLGTVIDLGDIYRRLVMASNA